MTKPLNPAGLAESRYIKIDPNDNVAIVVNDFGCQQRHVFRVASNSAISFRKAIRLRSLTSPKARLSVAITKS